VCYYICSRRFFMTQREQDRQEANRVYLGWRRYTNTTEDNWQEDVDASQENYPNVVFDPDGLIAE
jgi:hypothetical protein